MNETMKKRVDALLQNWSHRHAPADEHIAAVHRRIAAVLWSKCSDRPSPSPSTAVVLHSGARPRSVYCGGAVMVAASVLVATVWVAYRLPKAGPQLARPTLPASQPGAPRSSFPGELSAAIPGVVPSAAELAAQEKLLAETQRLFDTRVLWLAEEADQLRVGLSEAAPEIRDRAAAVAVRLVVTRRNQHAPTWTTIRSIDVIARSESAVQIIDDHQGLFLWAYVLPDGMIAIDTDLSVISTNEVDARGDAFRATSSAIHRPGVPELVASGQLAGERFQIFQVASLIPASSNDKDHG